MALGQEDKGQDQKFVLRAFTLEAKIQRTIPSKMPMDSTFCEFWRQEFGKSLSSILMETQTLLKRTNFFSKHKQTPQFVYINGLLPCPLKGSSSKVLSTQCP
jgi:hypothetical protein